MRRLVNPDVLARALVYLALIATPLALVVEYRFIPIDDVLRHAAKAFQIAERKQFQIRAEAYNLLNHNNLDDPNMNMQSTDFTRILSRSGNRSMQIGLRLQF
jgi:hypothetical protein